MQKQISTTKGQSSPNRTLPSRTFSFPRCKRFSSGDVNVGRTLSEMFHSPSKQTEGLTSPKGRPGVRRTSSFGRALSMKRLIRPSDTDDDHQPAEDPATTGSDASVSRSDSASRKKNNTSEVADELLGPLLYAPNRLVPWVALPTCLPGGPDQDEKAIDELETLARDLERMARILGKANDPEEILLKNLKQQATRGGAA